MGVGWLNIGSIILGLVAWIFPLVSLKYCDKEDYRNWGFFSILSVSSCAISLFMQILYTHYQVEARDWAGIEDTFYAVVFASTTLLVVNLLLNAIPIILIKRRR